MAAEGASLVAGSFVMSIALLVAACGGTDGTETDVLELDDATILEATRTWANQLGLAETDVDLWRERLQRACRDGVWVDEVARDLAAEFIAADLAKSVRDESRSDPTVGEGAQALWLMSVQVCRDAFPPEAIEAGPPSP